MFTSLLSLSITVVGLCYNYVFTDLFDMLKHDMLKLLNQIATSITLFSTIDQSRPQADDAIREHNHNGSVN